MGTKKTKETKRRSRDPYRQKPGMGRNQVLIFWFGLGGGGDPLGISQHLQPTGARNTKPWKLL